MKLSEAIRKGCEIVPQKAVGSTIVKYPNGTFSACVLGAAMVGCLGRLPGDFETFSEDWFKVSSEKYPFLFTVPNGEEVTFQWILSVANDEGADREDIVEFLEWMDL